MRILLVDDEPAIIAALQPALTAQGYTMFSAATALEALREAGSRQIDLVLLDLGLPDADGIDIIAQLKALAGATVIVLSARHLETEKVRALDEGAELIAPREYRLSGILRGQAGTDGVAPETWPAGARFVLIDGAVGQLDLPASARGVERTSHRSCSSWLCAANGTPAAER